MASGIKNRKILAGKPPNPARPGRGRPPGSRNKITADLKDKLLPLEEKALARVGRLLNDPKTPPGVVVAAFELILAYRHGKPKPYVEPVRGAMPMSIVYMPGNGRDGAAS